MKKTQLLNLLLVLVLVALGVIAGNYFWLNPPLSTATLNLRKELSGVTEVRIRVGCISQDSGSTKKIVHRLKGAEAQAFIQTLQVSYGSRTMAPMACNHYTFEFYKGKTLVTEIAYFPTLLVWSNWNDGHAGRGRKLNYKTRKSLDHFLAPYEDIRKATMYAL